MNLRFIINDKHQIIKLFTTMVLHNKLYQLTFNEIHLFFHIKVILSHIKVLTHDKHTLYRIKYSKTSIICQIKMVNFVKKIGVCKYVCIFMQ